MTPTRGFEARVDPLLACLVANVQWIHRFTCGAKTSFDSCYFLHNKPNSLFILHFVKKRKGRDVIDMENQL